MKARALSGLGLGAVFALSAALGLLVACGSSGAPDMGSFGETPASVFTSDTGTHRIAVHSAPDAEPSRGLNSLRLVITHVADGTPATGLELNVVPWMPAMGHGTSVKPTVKADAEPGIYMVENVNLFMPGLWEVRTTLGGSASDHATAQFEVR